MTHLLLLTKAFCDLPRGHWSISTPGARLHLLANYCTRSRSTSMLANYCTRSRSTSISAATVDPSHAGDEFFAGHYILELHSLSNASNGERHHFPLALHLSSFVSEVFPGLDACPLGSRLLPVLFDMSLLCAQLQRSILHGRPTLVS